MKKIMILLLAKQTDEVVHAMSSEVVGTGF